MTRQLLKQAGVLSISLGLLATPLAFADMHEPSAADQEAGDPMTSQPADPAADPMTDPDAPPAPGTPADEPGFGSGTDPMPTGEEAAQPDNQDDWEMPDDQEQESDW